MTIPWGAIISGGAALGGGLLGSSSAAQQNKEEREWQEKMSGSQYQRAVSDMRAAGLNPAMLYGKGPMSAPASGGARMDESVGKREGITRAGAAIMEGQLMKAQINDINSAKNLKDEQAEAVAQQRKIEFNDWRGKVGDWKGDPNDVNNDQWMAQWGALQRTAQEQAIAEALARTKGIGAQQALTEAQEGVAKVEKRIKEAGIPEAEAWRDYWKAVGVYGVLPQVVGQAADAAGSVGSLFSPFGLVKNALAGRPPWGGAASAKQVKGYVPTSRGDRNQRTY